MASCDNWITDSPLPLLRSSGRVQGQPARPRTATKVNDPSTPHIRIFRPIPRHAPTHLPVTTRHPPAATLSPFPPAPPRRHHLPVSTGHPPGATISPFPPATRQAPPSPRFQ